MAQWRIHKGFSWADTDVAKARATIVRVVFIINKWNVFILNVTVRIVNGEAEGVRTTSLCCTHKRVSFIILWLQIY